MLAQWEGWGSEGVGLRVASEDNEVQPGRQSGTSSKLAVS